MTDYIIDINRWEWNILKIAFIISKKVLGKFRWNLNGTNSRVFTYNLKIAYQSAV